MTTYDQFVLQPPQIFISYCWSNINHENRVIDLAKRLMSDGVIVKIDKWDLKEGQDKYKFMELMVKDDSIKKVLIICDKKYTEKADSRKGGVGTEAQIITPELYNNAEQTKFIPIVFERDENENEYLPIFLHGRIYLDFSNEKKEDEEYHHLLENIFERPHYQKPPLGSPPSFIFEEKVNTITRTNLLAKRMISSLREGNRSANGIFDEYIEELFDVLITEFKIDFKNSQLALDDLVLESINSFLPYRDEFIQILNHLLMYKVEKTYFESIYKLINRVLNLIFQLNENGDKYLYDNYKFILWELFLYTICKLIQERKIEEYLILVDQPYYISASNNQSLYNFTKIRNNISSLDIERKNRLDTNLKSISTDELYKRCYGKTPFIDIVQTDLVLYLRSLHNEDNKSWFPMTLIYANTTKLELFQRAEIKKEFEYLLKITGFSNKNELQTKILENGILQNRYFFMSDVSLTQLANIEKLGTR